MARETRPSRRALTRTLTLLAAALLVGWAAGMVYGTIEAYRVINPATGKHFGGSLADIPVLGDLGYIALTAFVLNVAVLVVLTLLFRALRVPEGNDGTVVEDYVADAIGSRRAENKEAALSRLERAGAEVVTTEMVVFEWLGSADDPNFKSVIALVK